MQGKDMLRHARSNLRQHTDTHANEQAAHLASQEKVVRPGTQQGGQTFDPHHLHK